MDAAIFVPSGDQDGGPWATSGLPTVASRRSFEPSRSKTTSRDSCFSGTPRQNAILFPSGEKVTRESTSNARSRGVPPSDGTCTSAR